jgi:hypothetical protein
MSDTRKEHLVDLGVEALADALLKLAARDSWGQVRVSDIHYGCHHVEPDLMTP